MYVHVCGVHVVVELCGVLSVCVHVECMRECLYVCVWYVVCGGVECMCVCVCVQSVSVIKNRQVFPWDPLQSTPGDRLHTQVFPGIAHHRGQTTQRPTPGIPFGVRGCVGCVECVECVWSVECVECVV